jgi:hypothetical protein
MITAYFDESGTHGQSTVAAFSGFTGLDAEWSSFSIQWRLCLGRHRLDVPFHMSEFESRKGAFSGLGDDQRLSLISSLADIIVKHDIAGYAFAVDIQKFQSLVGNRKRYGKAADPYYLLTMLAMAYCILGWGFLRERLKLPYEVDRERILFVFDRKPKFVQLSNLVFDSMLSVHPWVKPLVSNQIIFGSREEHAPLQAADMLAYETYKRTLDPNRADRKLFSALKPAFDSIMVLRDEELTAFNFDSTLASIRRK